MNTRIPFISQTTPLANGESLNWEGKTILPLEDAAEWVETKTFNRAQSVYSKNTNSSDSGFSLSEQVALWARVMVARSQGAVNYYSFTSSALGFPASTDLSSQSLTLHYQDTPIFAGSAWDLLMDLLTSINHTNTSALAHDFSDWMLKTRPSALQMLPEKADLSVSQRVEYIWRALVGRATVLENWWKQEQEEFERSEREGAEPPAPLRVGATSLMPEFVRHPEIVFEVLASPLWQKWFKHATQVNPTKACEVWESVATAGLDMEVKTQVARQLTHLVGKDQALYALRHMNDRCIIQGLWKSYSAVASGAGLSVDEAVRLRSNSFRLSWKNNLTGTLMWERFLPVFKHSDLLMSSLNSLPLMLWEHSLSPKADPLACAKTWAVWQKHDVVPSSVTWATVRNQLIDCTHPSQAEEVLGALLVRSRLKEQLKDVIETDPAVTTSSPRRRM